MFHRFLLAILLTISTPAFSQDIRVEDAYARVTPHSGAIFLHIINSGSGDERLLSLETPIAKSAMLHENTVVDGIASMKPLPEGLTIPAQSEIALERAGNHVMLMGLDEKLNQGSNFPLTLVFEHAGEITINVLVDNARTSG